MRLRPNLHDLYVGRVVLATVLLTWACWSAWIW